jgi:hypothetical protein
VSQKLVDRSPDLKRLRDEGFDLKVYGDHVGIGSVPYVTAKREVKLGLILCVLDLAQNVATRPQCHTVWFAGETPCDKHGKPLAKIIISEGLNQTPVKDLPVQFQFSSKPRCGHYTNYYEKLTTYVKILLHEAQALDTKWRADIYPVVVNDEADSPFKYYDTSSSRSGISAISTKLALPRIAIVGLGGTGAYVLDLVAKTYVREIHLFDDDEFSQHTAFRCPGAVGLEELTPNLKKVDHYTAVYSKLRDGVIPHDYRITPANVEEIACMHFVFLCLDSGELKDAIMAALEKAGVPFIDVGMGIVKKDEALSGILRATTSTAAKRDHIRAKGRISFAPAVGKNEYSQNIQVADLNALNASLAVVKWKKHFGFYHDLHREHHTTFVIETNKLGNEDLP